MTHWNDPIGLAAANRQTNAGFGNWGDEIWDIITAKGAPGQYWRRKTIARELAAVSGLAQRTCDQYVGAFIAYAIAAPHCFSGPASRITRHHNGTFFLADGPE